MAHAADYNWDKLESYTKQAADTILASFREADLDMYKHFLNSMYHYTLHSGERLEFASRVAETDELKAFYKELADDEESHYRLAQADLEEFGEQVDPNNPPEPVQRFHEYWQSLAKQHSSAYLGVLYVAENIAKFATGPVLEMFPKLELTKAQTRWLRVHAEVDLEHGAEVQEMCANYMDQYEPVITDAARQMSQFWIDIMHEGFYGRSAPRA
ncbi:MAG TPA: iron-containing redox enzyme family protein [Pseudomonadales bacterium]